MISALVSPMSLSGWSNEVRRTSYLGSKTRSEYLFAIEKMIFENPHGIPLGSYVDLLERIGKSREPYSLSWVAAQSDLLPFESRVSTAVLACSSLGSSLQKMCQYFSLMQDGSMLRLEVEGEWATLSYKILYPNIWPRHEDAVYTIGIFANLINTVAPTAWKHSRIEFESEPRNMRLAMHGKLQSSITFRAGANSISIPARFLSAHVNTVRPIDPSIFQSLSAELSKKTRQTSLSERAQRVIYSKMSDGSVSQHCIAQDLGISARTLRRKLSDEGKPFQKLLDDCRMQFALLELSSRSTASLSDIALKLGYSEHCTFSRAFIRWTGMSPQAYRREADLG